jgi:hypothetical protein
MGGGGMKTGTERSVERSGVDPAGGQFHSYINAIGNGAHKKNKSEVRHHGKESQGMVGRSTRIGEVKRGAMVQNTDAINKTFDN